MLLIPLTAYGQTDTNIEQKLREIIIPVVEFRDASSADVLNFFTEACTFPDPATLSLSRIETNREFFTYEVEDGSPLELPALTLEYRRISMLEAFDRITKEMGLAYRFENGAPIFFTKDGKRIIRKKSVEQAGPAYPPQGVGSADP